MREGRQDRSWRSVWLRRLALLAIGLTMGCGAFFFEHKFAMTADDIVNRDENATLDTYVDGAEQGSARRKIVMFSFAALGVAFTFLSRGKSLNLHWGIILVTLALVTWAALSITWSSMPEVSVRRLGVACCTLLGAIGLGRLLTLRELSIVAAISLSLTIAASFILQSLRGSFPHQTGYRFSGTIHANVQAAYCVTLALAALSLMFSTSNRQWVVMLCLLLAAVVMLVLTGSRTNLVGLVAASLVVVFANKSLNSRVLLGSLAALVVGVALFSLVLVGPTAQRQLLDKALMGRAEDVTTATGRLPLWEELWSFAEERPLTGHGYEAFWDSYVMKVILERERWAVSHAHNAYLELTLQLGIVGLSLALLLTLLLVRRTALYARDQNDPEVRFLLGLMTFYLASSMTESFAVQIQYPTVLLLSAAAAVSLYKPRLVFSSRPVRLAKEFSADPPGVQYA